MLAVGAQPDLVLGGQLLATALSADGNVFVAGGVYFKMQLGNVVLTPLHTSGDGFVAKYSPTTGFVWAVSFASAATATNGGGEHQHRVCGPARRQRRNRAVQRRLHYQSRLRKRHPARQSPLPAPALRVVSGVRPTRLQPRGRQRRNHRPQRAVPRRAGQQQGPQTGEQRQPQPAAGVSGAADVLEAAGRRSRISTAGERSGPKRELPSGRPGRCVGERSVKVTGQSAFVKAFEHEGPIVEVGASLVLWHPQKVQRLLSALYR